MAHVRKNKATKKNSSITRSDTDATFAPSKVYSKNSKTTEKISNSYCGWFCSWFKFCFIVILLPPFLNYAALHQERRFLLASETLYDVTNGQMMSFKCEGQGKPTVLLEAPTGFSSDVWSVLLKQLSQVTKVCLYDRAGLGFSDRPLKRRENSSEEENPNSSHRWTTFTVERMVDDLFKLISYRSQQVEKPFIFVGSEMGALIARFYTQIYEVDVSDIVLINPLVENLFESGERIWSNHWFNEIIPKYQMMQLFAALGLSRFGLMTGLLEQPFANSKNSVTEDMVMRQKHLLCHPKHLSSVVDEHHFINESFSQMQTLFMMKAFPSNVSVTVITGSYYDEEFPKYLNDAWEKSQQQLSLLHSSANFIKINGADRKMLYTHPKAVIAPIKRLITANRRQQKTEKYKA